ncbi:MAG: hypothetical protein K9N49_04325, partial [Candidatus Marinimicrobia bacterium]|nr:hypothetical protein [Candidatus Neomarinimicrobiota bacterium]
EFDGLETVTLTLTPKRDLEVDSMVLEIPLADIRHYSAGVHRGRLEGRRTFDGIAHIWLAGDKIGLVWSAESYRGWRIDSRQPRIVVEQEGAVTRLRLLLVNTAATVSAPMEIRFFRHPTPLKPMPEGYRDWRFSPGWSPHLNLWSQHNAVWNSALAKPTPRSWDVLRESVAFAREYGQRTYPFNIPLWMSHYHMRREEAPFIRPDLSREEREALADGQDRVLQERDDNRRVEEAIYFFEDWNIVPPQRSGRTDVGTIYYCSPSSSYADYWAHSLEQLLVQGGIDGIYMDLANVNRPCFNPEKNHAYTTLDGETEGTMELVAARNFYKRLYYVLLKHRGPEGAPHMLGHGSVVPSIYTSFWGLAFMGELFKPGDWFDMTKWYLQQDLFAPRMLASPEPDAPRSYDAFVYRALYPQAQFGIPTMILPQYSKGSADPPTQRRMNQDPALAREMLAFTFLHDQILWPSRVHVYTVYSFWEKTRMAEWADATFHPYWSNGLATAPEAVRASYWRREDGAHLVAVANWSSAPVTAEWALPATAVGVDEVLDVERGETLPAVAGRLAAEIPPHDLRVFRMGGTE